MCVCIYLCSFIYIYISRDKSDHRLAKVGYFMHQFVSHSRTRDFSSSRDSKIIRQNCNVWYCCAQVRILQNHRLRRNKSKRCDFGELYCELVCCNSPKPQRLALLRSRSRPTTNPPQTRLLRTSSPCEPIYVYLCVCVCVGVRVCVYMYTHTHTQTHMTTARQFGPHPAVRAYVSVYVCVYVYTQTHTHTHTHTHDSRETNRITSLVCVCVCVYNIYIDIICI